MSDDDLVKRLRGPQSAEVDYATRQEGADRIEALQASNLRLSGALYDMTAERDRLREALKDAWDAHNKHGDQMSGWWVHDDALKGETP